MNNPHTPSKLSTKASGSEMFVTFITDFIDPTTIPPAEQYIKNGPFIAKVFLTFNPMPWLAETYPALLAPDYGLPLILTMFKPPDVPSGGETPWYSVPCKLHPYRLEFPGRMGSRARRSLLPFPGKEASSCTLFFPSASISV